MGFKSGLFLVLVFYGVTASEALQCYVCSSNSDAKCSGHLTSNLVKYCDGGERCFLDKTTMYNDKVIFTRGCTRNTTFNFGENRNYFAAPGNGNITIRNRDSISDTELFLCSYDYCNGDKNSEKPRRASSASALRPTLIFLGAVVLFKVLF